jgi:hypothetical protein
VDARRLHSLRPEAGMPNRYHSLAEGRQFDPVSTAAEFWIYFLTPGSRTLSHADRTRMITTGRPLSTGGDRCAR